jgi:hypothetical protein
MCEFDCPQIDRELARRNGCPTDAHAKPLDLGLSAHCSPCVDDSGLKRRAAGRRRDGAWLRLDGGRQGWARIAKLKAEPVRSSPGAPSADEPRPSGGASVPVGREHEVHPAGGRQQA